VKETFGIMITGQGSDKTLMLLSIVNPT